MDDLVSSAAPAVFAEVESTGKHSAYTSMALHEAVIARVNIELTGESLIIRDTWPEFARDFRVQPRSLREEYARLQRVYGSEMLVSVYGHPHEGRLRKVMLRIHEAYLKGIKPSKIVELGRPDGDFIELPSGGIERTKLGRDTDAATKVDSSVLSNLNATVTNPEDVKDIGGDDTPEEQPLDGELVEFLTGVGWNEPQANAVARLVRDKGIQSIADADIASIPGIRNAEARKSLRTHLTEYRTRPKAAAHT